MKTTLAIAFCFTAVAFSGRALAHHAFAAEFDNTKEVKVTGTVTKMEWQNPHIWFFVDVKGEDGGVANWGFQMASPSQLLRAGWKRDTIKPGDVVAVEGNQARDGTTNAFAEAVVLTATGQRVFTMNSGGRGGAITGYSVGAPEAEGRGRGGRGQ
jgi:hypothetical protein